MLYRFNELLKKQFDGPIANIIEIFFVAFFVAASGVSLFLGLSFFIDLMIFVAGVFALYINICDLVYKLSKNKNQVMVTRNFFAKFFFFVLVLSLVVALAASQQ